MKTMTLALVAAVTLCATQAAALPEVVSYAARIENDAGAFDGTVTVTFELFGSRLLGAALWSETVSSVVVVDGDLVHDLGSIEALDDDVLDRADLFLSVTIDGDTLEPRVPLRAVPYALKARDAESLAGLSADDVATDDEVSAALADVPSDADVAAAVAARVVSFAELAAVPDGFADGVDNDTVAVVLAGGGLKTAGNAFSIEDNGVTLARMADNSVGSAEVSADSLTAADLAAGCVGTSEIADNAVTSVDIADNAVTSADIAADSVTGADIAAAAITSSELADDAVTATKINGTLITLFSRPAGCGGGLQVGNASCKTVVCDEDVANVTVVTGVAPPGLITTTKGVADDVEVIFSECDGSCGGSALAKTCAVTAAGTLLPVSF